MLYVDGGYLYWTPGFADGHNGAPTTDNNPLGLIYTLNFSTAFSMSQNISAVMRTLSKAGGGSASNIAPNYYDGALLANDDEFFLYGGMLADTNDYNEPDGDKAYMCEVYQYGVEKPAFSSNTFSNAQLNHDLTRYIAYGGAANVPSENMAFYFSGMQSPDHGPIIYPPSSNDSLNAINVSNTLISVDMSTEGSGNWSNITLPDSIPGRANSELVWVPVGSEGILVALGGVVYPDFVNETEQSGNETASEEQSPAFMSNINIYDIAAGKWYTQPTSDGPSQLTRGCAVMQPAQDYSSFNIYYYGGYDGLHPTDPSYFKDDVWILSLPTFVWEKVASGRQGYGRAGHKCVMPYPDQMMVIGGYPALEGTTPCLNGSIIELFNVSSAEWLDRYDPAVWSEYGVPSKIYQRIGGDNSGGATSVTPSPSGWATPALASVFATAYATSKITKYYPYASVAANNSTLPTLNPDSGSHSGSSVPKFLPPLLGVILGLIFVSSVVVGVLVWRRRRYLKKHPEMSVKTDENKIRILSWMRYQNTEGKNVESKTPTVVTSDVARSPDPEYFAMLHPQQHADQRQFEQQYFPHEMGNDTQVAELMAFSPVAELQDTSLSPVEIIEGHTHFGSGANASPLANRSLALSSAAATDHASIVSSNSNSAAGGGALASSLSNPLTSQSQARPDSSALPPMPANDDDDDQTPRPLQSPTQEDNNNNSNSNEIPNVAPTPSPQPAPRGDSGVSAFSERDRLHLRNISDPATVSTMDGTLVGSPRLAPEPAVGRVASPPIPEEGAMTTLGSGNPSQSTPPAGETDAEDYVSLRNRSAVVSPVNQNGPYGASSGAARRSIFRESREDMGGSS